MRSKSKTYHELEKLFNEMRDDIRSEIDTLKQQVDALLSERFQTVPTLQLERHYEDEQNRQNGLKIRAIRKSMNMTQTTFAAALGITAPAICQIEKGIRPQSAKSLLEKLRAEATRPKS